MDATLLAALAEPNRLRIVELLSAAPRPVGEIAATLGLRQPQVSKHLQSLERAGLVVVYPLAQRRIYALRRETFGELAVWLAELQRQHPSEGALEEYRTALEGERGDARTIRVRRTLRAPRETVWSYWTHADRIRRWWAPDHFRVVEAEADPVPGGVLRIVMAEGDGAHHVAIGRYVELAPPTHLSFHLAPLGPDGAALFAALHTVRFAQRDGGTGLSLAIRITEVTPAAVTALAGVQIGWRQLLKRLAGELRF